MRLSASSLADSGDENIGSQRGEGDLRPRAVVKKGQTMGDNLGHTYLLNISSAGPKKSPAAGDKTSARVGPLDELSFRKGGGGLTARFARAEAAGRGMPLI